MSQPESGMWYVEQLEATSEEIARTRYDIAGLSVGDDGEVGFTAYVRYDHLITGSDTDEFRRLDHFQKFAEVRQRLGLAFDLYSIQSSDLGSFNYRNPDSFLINFGKPQLTDTEAIFIIAFPLFTIERPAETVFEEIRQAARLGLKETVEMPPSPLEAFQKTVHCEKIPRESIPKESLRCR